ncbi:hypothetical protein OFP52_07165 [Escherichia coli]|nr:hypothetical protein [Escherichia coli]MCV5325191.1 hypothetical protein [Escherichia coli]MCV5344739.1 hypothetical protein [Escherichia coli]MCV5355164.1 hypothetical protein [Escherichia coli]MCV5400433.1 hypothetical protein [Escherichia coli]
MTRLAILVTTYILSFSANAVSDMVADMQKTYSKFTTLDNVKYEARGTVQPVWFRYSDNAEETPISGESEHMRLQIMGTAVKEGTSANSGKALVPSYGLLNVIDGTMYCDEIAKSGCPIHIRVGSNESFTTYGKIGNDATGKVLVLDNAATIRLLKDIKKTAKSDIDNKTIYIEAPFLVAGSKQFKFGLLDTPLKVD